MTFEMWGHTFEGAFLLPNDLQPRPGICVIWCRSGKNWRVIDVGQSADVRDRVAFHDRVGCWERNCNGAILYSATYTPGILQAGRIRIEQQIRTAANPPCGEN